MRDGLRRRADHGAPVAPRTDGSVWPAGVGWAIVPKRPHAPGLRAMQRTPAPSASTLFLVALAVRVAFFTIAGRYRFSSDFGFGWETGRIARALATGRGFSDPFHGLTGPTAWIAPLYPLLLASIFKLCGVYTALSGWVTLLFNSACSALTGVVLSRSGSDLFGDRAGRRVGWTWALLPYAIYWPTKIVWDTNLTACLLAVAFMLALR